MSSRPMVRNAPRRRKAPARRKTTARPRAQRAVPRAPSSRPAAGYTYDKPGPFGQVGRAAGALIGAKYGGPLGAALGGKLGSYAHYIGKIFGSGDYVSNLDRVKSNIIVNDSQIPRFGSDPNTVSIRHREYLGDVITSSSANTFSIQTFSINPGQNYSFPWLSQVCGGSFQQYRINGMVFEYRTMSADALNSTNTALGSVVMATDYDSSDAIFTTKQQMENTEYGVSCKPSVCMLHAIECARNQSTLQQLYVRVGAVPSGSDIRMYDMGKFSIATTGFQGTSVNIGELWVSYDISFFKAVQEVPALLSGWAFYNVLTGAVPASAPLGTAPVLTTNGADTIGITFTGNKVQFPYNIPVKSKWIVLYELSGSAAACTAPVFSWGNGMADVYHNRNDPSTASVSNYMGYSVMVYNGGGTPAALPYFNIANFTYASTLTGATIQVQQINGSSAE